MLKVVRVALGFFLIAHGSAHFMATSVYWKLFDSEKLPYSTKILDGHLDLGETGVALFGLVWLLAGMGMVAAGLGVVVKVRQAVSWLLAASVFSLVICILVPDKSMVGIAIDLMVLGVLLVGSRLPIRTFRAAEAR